MKNYFDLSGKVALITGGSSGLGVQAAKALGNQGAKLALVARRVERLEAVKKELNDMGFEVFIHKCDVTKSDEVKVAVEAIKNNYGTIDILLNCAGVGSGGKAVSLSDEDWLKVIDTNLNSVFYMTREVGKIMLEKGYGKIINFASFLAEYTMKDFPVSAYSSSKAGVVMLTKSTACEWAKNGITVNAIGPGWFESEMTASLLNVPRFQDAISAYCPMGRIGKPGELDGAIIYFASDASSYTTGQFLKIEGGWGTI